MKNLTLILTAAVVGLMGCTKEKPYKKLTGDDKVKLESLSLFNPILPKESALNSNIKPAEYIMMVSNVGTDRISPAIEYYMGYTGKVKFDMTTEGKLRVISEDEHFTTNPLNKAAVITIPVEHVDFRCSEDDFGKCTNKEEKDTDKKWYDRKLIKPNFGELSSTTPMIDLEFDKFFSSRSCVEPESTKLVEFKSEGNGDALNITVERIYKFSCIPPHVREWNDLVNPNNLTFKVRQNFSFAKKSLMASEDYVPLKTDIASAGGKNTRFGFFQTEKKIYDSSTNVEQRDDRFVNRWNPNRRKITYYLDKKFNEPRNAGLKKATLHAANLINQAFSQAGAKVRLEVKDHDPKFIDGDVRVSQILLSEDPIVRGLLGYGPHVNNPDTGEILSARVAMYSGIIKKTIRGAYNDIIELANQEESLSPHQRQQLAEGHQQAVSNGREVAQEVFGVQPYLARTSDEPVYRIPNQIGDIGALTDTEVLDRLKNYGRDFEDVVNDFVTEADELAIYHAEKMIQEERESGFKHLKKMRERFMRNTFYPVDMFNEHAAIDKHIGKIKEKYGLKPWLPNTPEYAGVENKLSEAEKQEIIDLLVPVLYVPTLVHEWGHNLGLRHNFEGSFDQANWYASKFDHDDPEAVEASDAIEVKEDLALFEKLGINRKIEYSSIMDYAYGTMNELNIMGKYDVAALRYAYGFSQDPRTGALEPGSLEFVKKDASTGEIIEKLNVPNNEHSKEHALAQQFELREYGFCTDESVALNTTCNRFDEGTSYTGVVQHYIDAYEENYHRRYLRNGRRYMDKAYGDWGHYLRLRGLFGDLRMPFELYELIKNSNGLADDAAEWRTNPILADIKAATVLSGQFFLDVIRTPDAHCRLSPVANPVEKWDRVPFIPLEFFGGRFAHCGEVQLDPSLGVLVSGQVGKSLNSKKSRMNPNASVAEIDVRGIWLDKLMAMKALFLRKTDFTGDDYDQNYMIVPEVRAGIFATMRQIFTDQLSGDMRVSFQPVFSSDPDKALGGFGVEENFSYSLHDDNAGLIDMPLIRWVGMIAGLPERKTYIQYQFIKTMRENSFSDTDVSNDIVMQNFLDLRVIDPLTSTINLNEYVRLGGMIYDDTERAVKYLIDENNVAARSVLTLLNESDTSNPQSTLSRINKFLDRHGVPDDLDRENPENAPVLEAIRAENRRKLFNIALVRIRTNGNPTDADLDGMSNKEQILAKDKTFVQEVLIAFLTNNLKEPEFYKLMLRGFARTDWQYEHEADEFTF